MFLNSLHASVGKTLLMQKIVDLKNTIGILKPYSNFASFIHYLVVNSFKKRKQKLVTWKDFVKTIISKNQTFKVQAFEHV